MSKKNVLILGSKGMLGHIVERYLTTFPEKYHVTGLNREDGLDARNMVMPVYPREYDYIINCVGILNNSDDIQLYSDVNVVFPKLLAQQCSVGDTKLIHISTNCVFANIGPHLHRDIPDATDLYGRSKAMGEIITDEHLTIRCSIIGTELKHEGTGLINQFMTNPDFDTGFKNIFWNGVTTLQLAIWMEENMDSLVGLQHYFTQEVISKYDLLEVIRSVYQIDKPVYPAYRTMHQSLLDGQHYTPKGYFQQIRELREFNDNG